ncbi:MAG: peptidoglycan bridge formation glycyltransferase FemA/FemB family protein [Clostridia bacterium]|nr:peptidoglycan bridge formation glycyltransferase FemA/FemB family protein [Clostridia bacterium]
MKITDLSEKELTELNEFLENHPKSHFMQSPEWAKVKTDWINEILIVRNPKSNKIVGTMSVLIRKIPGIHQNMMYAPRGFVCNPHDRETLQNLTNQVKELAKKYKAFIFKMDPDISNADAEFKILMKSLGYKFTKDSKKASRGLQPRIIERITLTNKTEEELLKSFNEKHRYNVRLSARKGVTLREGTKEDLPIFYDIMKTTEARDNFYVRPLSYFEKMWDAMGEDHIKLIFAEYEGQAISAVLPIKYGNKVWYLYGGSSNNHRNLMPNYLLQFEMMKWGLNTNCDIYDFRGVSGVHGPNHPQYGIYIFKKGFNGDIIELVEGLTIVFNPFVNFAFDVCESIYKTLTKMKFKRNVSKEK